MKSWTQRTAWLLPLLGILAVLAPFSAEAGATPPVAVISSPITYPVTGLGSSQDNLAVDKCGNLYVMDAENGGQLYEIPANGGAATLNTLASGHGQGWNGGANFIGMDNAKNNLFVGEGNGHQVVFRIPIVNCVLQNSAYNFSAWTGIYAPPGSGSGAVGNSYWWKSTALAGDAAGNMFVATGDNGLFEIYLATDSSGNSGTQLIGSGGLSSAIDSMVIDSSNNLYYVIGDGKIYELTFSAGAYATTAVTLSGGLAGNKLTGLAVDGLGNLYVTDTGASTISVIPNETIGSTTALNPADQYIVASGISAQYAVAIDLLGNLYFANWGAQIGEVTPGKMNVGSVSAGGNSTGTANVVFNAAVTPKTITFSSGSAFSSSGGLCAVGTAYTAGQTCTISVKFHPLQPGVSVGGITVADASNNVLATAYLQGTGLGAGLTLDSGNVTSIGSGFVSPKQIAVTSSGGYIADASAKNVLYFATPTSTSVLIGNNLTAPAGVAVDAFGNVLISDSTLNEIVEVPFVNGALSNAAQITITPVDTKGKPAAIAGTVLSGPTGLTLDASGNLYIADTGNNRILLVPYDGSWNFAQAMALGSNLSGPLATTVDPSGNLYVADSGHGEIYEVPAPATGGNQELVAVGYSNPSALATDASGSLFIVNQGAQSIVRIPNFSGILNPNDAIEVGFGIANPYGLALDSAGNLYVTDSTDATASQVNRVSISEAFGDWPVGTPSGALPVQLENEGNQTLTFASPYSTTTGDTGDFSLGSPTDVCASAGTVVAGEGCEIDATFQATITGVRTETLVLNSNAQNAPALQVVLTGTGIASATTTTTALAITAPTSAPIFGQSITLTATITPSSGTLTGSLGNAELLVDGDISAVGTVNSKGVATLVLATGLTGGSHTLQAVYLGTSSYDGSISAILPVQVGTAPTTSVLTVNAPNTNPYSALTGKSVAFTVTISSTGVGIPAGSVTFTDTTTSGATTLAIVPPSPAAGGTFQASMTTTALPSGTNQITAVYSGDANFVGSTATPSATVEVVDSPTLVLSSTSTSLTGVANTYSQKNGSIIFNNTSEGGWTGIVNYHCLASTLPANAYCVFSPGQVTVTPNYPAAASQSGLQIIINTPPNSPAQSSMLWWLGGLTGLSLFWMRRRMMCGAWRNLTMLLAMVLLGASASGLMACNSGAQFVTPAGNSKVTVVADADPYTSGSTSSTQACGINATTKVGDPTMAPCSETTYQISLTVK
jgi:sugar lactone lactonase YvrE